MNFFYFFVYFLFFGFFMIMFLVTLSLTIREYMKGRIDKDGIKRMLPFIIYDLILSIVFLLLVVNK